MQMTLVADVRAPWKRISAETARSPLDLSIAHERSNYSLFIGNNLILCFVIRSHARCSVKLIASTQPISINVYTISLSP